MSAGRGYLLVYLAHSQAEGTWWFDQSNDPDLRYGIQTWGLCRANVRTRQSPAQHLFFIAYDGSRYDGSRHEGDRYYLASHFRLHERISHSAAPARFGERPNIGLDLLPGGGTVEDRLYKYALTHIKDLKWWVECSKREHEAHLADLRRGTEYAVLGRA